VLYNAGDVEDGHLNPIREIIAADPTDFATEVHQHEPSSSATEEQDTRIPASLHHKRPVIDAHYSMPSASDYRERRSPASANKKSMLSVTGSEYPRTQQQLKLKIGAQRSWHYDPEEREEESMPQHTCAVEDPPRSRPDLTGRSPKTIADNELTPETDSAHPTPQQLGRPKKDAHHGKPCDSEESEDFPLTLGTSVASETEEGNLRSTRSEYPPQQQQLSTIADPHHGRHYELEEREEGRMDPRVWVGEAGESPHPRPRPSHQASSRPLPSAMGHTPSGERTTDGFNSSQTRSAPFGLQHPRSRPRAAIACVCRDSFGMIRDGFAKHIEVSSTEQAEAVALVETLDFIS